MLAAAALAASLLLQPARGDTSTAALERTIARIAAESGATIGATAIHVETNRRVSVRGMEPFPMQSVYKLPIALRVLELVDEGKLRLDSAVVVRPADHRFGYSPLAEERAGRTTTKTVRELLERMAGQSDNTASDVLLRLAGGPAEVTNTLRWNWGIFGVRVDRSEGRLGLDFNGVAYAPGREARSVAEPLIRAVPPAARRAAVERYLADPRDTCMPARMARLLMKLAQGRGLRRPESHRLLMRILTETPTGADRLRARLPRGTPVAHKTGTSMTVDGMTAVVNDVGIITLPDGSHVAIAVFAKRSTRGTDAAERAIADIARAVYDHWSPPRGR